MIKYGVGAILLPVNSVGVILGENEESHCAVELMDGKDCDGSITLIS
jgi:hypothetical protein